MHELGHNFNSGHTFSDYSPVIDTCKSRSSCPAQLPLAKSATIMSYCHQCAGGYSNIEYTFGGKYSGVGLRSNMNSYSNSPLNGLGTVSIEPRRVNAKMWSHVSSRGTCTSPSNPGVRVCCFYFVLFVYVYQFSLTHSLSLSVTFTTVTYYVNQYKESHIQANVTKASSTYSYTVKQTHLNALVSTNS
jgi:hypothetical protein